MGYLKRITAAILAAGALSSAAYAYQFPQPDWGTLLSERRNLVSASEFELYTEGGAQSAPYYGARLEPRAGTYIGTVSEEHDRFKPLSSHLTYIEYGESTDMYYPSNSIVEGYMGDSVVAMIGWNTSTVTNINYDQIRRTLDNLNAYNKPMMIRFANEMNVSALGNEPDAYIETFRNVANMIHEYPNFAVVWSPNDMGALNRPFQYYYPGDEYVDWVGVSCYMTKYFQYNRNTTQTDATYFMTGDYAWATNKIKLIMDFMKKNNINKPVMISEGGVARSNTYGDDYSGWNEPRMRNMLWYLVMKYPQIKMINYFNKNYQSDGEKFGFSDYPASVQIFSEAKNSGAYMKNANEAPEFVFSPANNGETLIDKDGIVNLYTYAYFVNNPDISVNYKIDGAWFHSSNQIPYICKFDINSITDGSHTLTIEGGGTSKSYTLYKRGQYMSFGKEPDTSLPAPGTQSDDISVVINGNKLVFEQPPVIIDERTLVPLRAIFEALNAQVYWNDTSKTVTSIRGDINISLTVGDNMMYKNNEPVQIDVPAQIVNDYTLVPVRVVAEAFGAGVSWDGETRTVVITE